VRVGYTRIFFPEAVFYIFSNRTVFIEITVGAFSSSSKNFFKKREFWILKLAG